MIDIRTETILPFSQTARLACFAHRRNGRPINVATIWRWAMYGIRGVRMESIMLGGVRATSTEAVERFVAALTAAREARPVVQPPALSAARRRAIEAAEKKLAAAGV